MEVVLVRMRTKKHLKKKYLAHFFLKFRRVFQFCILREAASYFHNNQQLQSSHSLILPDFLKSNIHFFIGLILQTLDPLKAFFKNRSQKDNFFLYSTFFTTFLLKTSLYKNKSTYLKNNVPKTCFSHMCFVSSALKSGLMIAVLKEINLEVYLAITTWQRL